MFLQALDLTTALRPELLEDEILLFVQHSVGLYEGKFKLPAYQNGHVYLTSHRICYVDGTEPRRYSVAVDLKDVDKYEFYAGFLKSSSKVTLYPKVSKRSSIQPRTQGLHGSSPGLSPPRSATASPFPRGLLSSAAGLGSGARSQSINWVCPICSFPNTLPSNFDATTAHERTPLPPCQTCGIKPPLAHILKAAISHEAGRRQTSIAGLGPSVPDSGLGSRDMTLSSNTGLSQPPDPQSNFVCPRCTFQNHPSLFSCEMCGASLVLSGAPGNNSDVLARTDSPGPSAEGFSTPAESSSECLKLSFRSGGEKIFYERLKNAMVQRKWLLWNAPPVPQPSSFENGSGAGSSPSGVGTSDTRAVGIAGLERLGLERRKNNETVIGSAFSDLEALMASAKEVIALAESFAGASSGPSVSALLNEPAASLGMTATKDMLGSVGGSDELYLSELSRSLAEYLTDDRQSILKKEGGIVSLVDLWAKFNRARNGVELVSPADFEKAARLWEKLGLPVRLREFRNGVLAVQRFEQTDDKTIAQLLAWFQEFRVEELKSAVPWDWKRFGKGVTAHETAARFGWSVGVATEELEMAEEKGVLCREESIEGLKFWENWFADDEMEA